MSAGHWINITLNTKQKEITGQKKAIHPYGPQAYLQIDGSNRILSYFIIIIIIT
jgi:hypothetical protein